MTDPRDFEPQEIDKDTDEEDAGPVEQDEAPDVREDTVEDDPTTSPTAPGDE